MKWSEEKANAWFAAKGFVFGFNYITSTAVNSTEMWRRETFDPAAIGHELQMAAGLGYNACRVFLPFIVWENDPHGFMERLTDFLAAAAKNRISVMPVLFDDCAFSNKEPYWGPQDAPVKGIHNSGWTPSPGFRTADDPSRVHVLEAYMQSVLTAYKNDSRIIAWDLYNEPGNSERGEKSLPLLENAFQWARACGVTQPLTVGIWSDKAYESRFCDLSDVISFHEYGNLEKVKNTISQLRKYHRPMFCTEWLHRKAGSHFETHLPLWISENVGAYQWGMVAGKTQTYLSWNKAENSSEKIPEIWQHDLLKADGDAYDSKETGFIRKTININQQGVVQP